MISVVVVLQQLSDCHRLHSPLSESSTDGSSLCDVELRHRRADVLSTACVIVNANVARTIFNKINFNISIFSKNKNEIKRLANFF
jgi:hypothetical protein